MPCIPTGAWPSLMRASTAAGYLDEASVETFRRKVGRVYPKPVRVVGTGDRWRKADLDKWIAGDQTDTVEAALDAADFL